jgi:iron complex outermembrane receptor protein
MNDVTGKMARRRRAAAPLTASAAALLLATGPAFAEQAADTSGELEEVTVTAQFVRQNLQDTPVAITAVSAAMLESRGQESIQEIASQAPNVTLTTGGSYGGPSLVGFIRGVGQTDFDPALEPGVGLYVDDVYYSTLTGSVLDLLDLDRVEVLRGPQGTLAGKNSIGGSIKLYSKKPGPENDGYVEAGYGSYSAVTARGASNFTLIPDRLYARVSGVSRSRDGYITRLDYGCTHPGSALGAVFASARQGPSCVTGTEGGIKYTAGRLALRWLATDNLELNFAADVLNDVSEAPANVLLATYPTIAPIIVGGPGGVAIWPNLAGVPATLSGCEFIAYGPNSCDPQSPNNPYVNYATYTDPRSGLVIQDNQTVKSRGLSLNLDWKISDALDLQSISAYRRYVSGFGDDQSGSPMPIAMLYQTLVHNQKSEELRLNGKVGNLIDYTLGAFYFDQYTAHDAVVDLGYVGFYFLHGPDPVDAKTWALFGHTIIHATDKLDVSLGVRYSDDKKDYTYRRQNPDGSAIQPCLGPPGTPGNPPNCLISSLNGTSNEFKGTRTDYRAALSYRWTDALMTYAQFSTGFKGGGVNPRPFYNVQEVTFRPETLDAFEVGLKSQLLDNHLRLNLAAFFNKYKDIQLTLSDCTPLFGPVYGNPCILPANAGDADVKGAEAEVDWQLIKGLQIDGSYSYLHFKYTRVDAATGVGLSNVTPYTPKSKWSLGAQYEIALASAGSLTPRLDVGSQSKMYTDALNNADGLIDSYTLLNARVTWQSPDKDWQASLECQNLGDKLYYVSKTSGAPVNGDTFGAPGMPRTVMFTVKRSF